MMDLDTYLEVGEPGAKERAYAWATAIGLQQVDGLKPSKAEWVLNNEDSVHYTPSIMVKDTLEYEFDREKNFRYKGLSENAFVSHFAAFIASIWQIHPFREGNTRTVGLFAIKYLRSRGYAVTNTLFAEKSWYFRNALVRANYENDRRGVEKTLLPLEEFFRVLLFDAQIELRNRFLHIDYNYGTPTADAIAPLHRTTKKAERGSDQKSDQKILLALKQNPMETIAGLVESTGLSPSGVKKILRKLKESNRLRRIGPDKGGHWEVIEGEVAR